MADTEKSGNTNEKDLKEAENEKIKTENQETTLKNDTKTDIVKEDKSKTGLEVIKETSGLQDSDVKDESNNSNKAGEHTVTKSDENNKADVESNTNAVDKLDKSEDKAKAIKIDLKSVQTHYKTHTKTTLPHLLTEYGFEDKSSPRKSEKASKDKPKKKKKVEIVESADEEEKHMRKAREEKFRQMFGDSRSMDTYYMEYLDFLHEKVVKQRLQAQKQKEEEQRLAAIRAEQERKSRVTNGSEEELQVSTVDSRHKRRHTLTRRLPRMALTHDDTFLKDLPKTDLARIVKLQDKMKKEGKLKTTADVDKFWADIRDPDTFYAQFKVKRTFDPGPPPLAESKTPDAQPRSLSHISESSRDDKEPWAITQKYQSLHGQKTPTGDKPRKDSNQLAKEAALDLERRCPKLEMPPLACFSLKLGEKPPDPLEVQKKIELKAREKSRKKFQRKLQKMYQMAMTHSAASNRILAQHGDLTAIIDGGTLRDVLAVFDEPYSLEQHYRDMTDPSRQLEHVPDHISEVSQGSCQGSRQSSAGSRTRLTPISQTSSSPGSLSKRKKKSPEMIEAPREPMPLSFDEVITREKTMEPKCMSTLWTNYMQAGKSVFAPS